MPGQWMLCRALQPALLHRTQHPPLEAPPFCPGAGVIIQGAQPGILTHQIT